MYKQIIIARKDLNMSPGKLAAQVSHASMAFLTTMIRESAVPIRSNDQITCYNCDMVIGKNIFEQWINGEFTKVVLSARNRTQLLKAIGMAEELSMSEGIDYFPIRDNCHTELEPEEDGKTLTCVGFRPMKAEIIDQIGKKYQLWKN